MQFVRNGPDVPERLLQAHEDGRVVFFCGAGISYPAGLPSFQGLVKRVFAELGETPNAVQKAAIKARQYDTAIGLLEGTVVGRRETVRRALVGILEPDLSSPAAIETHEALLTLGTNREGCTRLITTNFDRLFEEVIARKGLSIATFKAPLLPIPKNRWDGLVYLHGLLSEDPTTSELHRLVLSSGDFGLAYLTERWAARFVSELFRSYTICFVGYSINDPVLRYMMDALAADRLLGESPPEMFAFGSYSKGKKDERANEWKAKNVTPILYAEHRKHAHLHKTLRAWANTYRDGVRGKERIVVECAAVPPSASTKQDDFVGRLLWALGDPSGLPAKHFADLDPAPVLEWLEPFCELRYGHDDLARFGVPPKPGKDTDLRFSLSSRPAPYTHAPWMRLVSAGPASSRWDNVMKHLARWLSRHLDDPKLLLWISKIGGQLHDELVWHLEHRLDELARLKSEGKLVELEQIRVNAPNAIPRPAMRTLWRLILTRRLKSPERDLDLYRFLRSFERDGLTTTLRIQLREMLAPVVLLREPIRWSEAEGDDDNLPKPKDLVEWEIVLSAEHVHSALSDLAQNERWAEALPELLPELTLLLKDALDLMKELGGADNISDRSFVHQPSVSEHPQNQRFYDWTALIDLTRDAWLATVARAPDIARQTAEVWRQISYPLFRRLVFFAATYNVIIPPPRAVSWLLIDSGWWLWSVETKREAMRLLVALAARLSPAELNELEQAILAGPPRSMFKDDVSPERWAAIVEREIWLRLAKLRQSGASLDPASVFRLEELSALHPQWKLATDESDEFPLWIGDGDEWRSFVITPRRRRDLVSWLRQHPTSDWQQEDDWGQRCRRDFATTACALYALTLEGVWPTERWREALQAWSEEGLVARSWRCIAPVLSNAPDELLEAVAHSLGRWLQEVGKVQDVQEELFFRLCRRLLAIKTQVGAHTEDVVTQAINHPVGHVTEALLRWWYRLPLEDGQGLPEQLKSVLTDICDTPDERFRHGRVLLAAHAITLFRVDRDWTAQHLLPLLTWRESDDEARAVWEGLLWTARLHRPFFEAIKAPFLNTARHSQRLGERKDRYASLLTFAALELGDSFTTVELRTAFRALPKEGVAEAAKALAIALQGAGDKREAYWDNRIAPFLRHIWPRSQELASPELTDGLFRVCIAAGHRLPQALDVLQAWLQPVPYPGHLVHLLHESRLSTQLPAEALTLLDRIIGDQPPLPRELAQLLDEIAAAQPMLRQDPRFARLDTYRRQRGS